VARAGHARDNPYTGFDDRVAAVAQRDEVGRCIRLQRISEGFERLDVVNVKFGRGEVLVAGSTFVLIPGENFLPESRPAWTIIVWIRVP